MIEEKGSSQCQFLFIKCRQLCNCYIMSSQIVPWDTQVCGLILMLVVLDMKTFESHFPIGNTVAEHKRATVLCPISYLTAVQQACPSNTSKDLFYSLLRPRVSFMETTNELWWKEKLNSEHF